MGRSALATINQRGNQILYRKYLAVGVTPVMSSEGLGANSKLIHNFIIWGDFLKVKGCFFFFFALDAKRVGCYWGSPWPWGVGSGS